MTTSGPCNFRGSAASHELITIDFTASVVQLNLPSHYFVNSKLTETTDITGVRRGSEPRICAQLPLFFKGHSSISIPKKVEFALRRHVSKKLLRQIHPDLEVAIELCLLFLEYL